MGDWRGKCKWDPLISAACPQRSKPQASRPTTLSKSSLKEFALQFAYLQSPNSKLARQFRNWYCNLIAWRVIAMVTKFVIGCHCTIEFLKLKQWVIASLLIKIYYRWMKIFPNLAQLQNLDSLLPTDIRHFTLAVRIVIRRFAKACLVPHSSYLRSIELNFAHQQWFPVETSLCLLDLDYKVVSHISSFRYDQSCNSYPHMLVLLFNHIFDISL